MLNDKFKTYQEPYYEYPLECEIPTERKQYYEIIIKFMMHTNQQFKIFT